LYPMGDMKPGGPLEIVAGNAENSSLSREAPRPDARFARIGGTAAERQWRVAVQSSEPRQHLVEGRPRVIQIGARFGAEKT
jgi:hypothetical protein